MGYRSDVKIITTKEGWARINEEVRKVSEGEDRLVSDVATLICDGKYVLAEWDDVKWYETYDSGVDAIMRELKRFDAEHIPYQYLRIGEDWDDMECLYERDWKSDKYDDMPDLVLVRKIEVEY